MRRALAITLVLGAVTAWSCRRATAPPRPPNVLLIVLDTTRADHLGCYGYARPTSPRLDAFASRATRYARAWAAASWTLPSHASIFTGRFAFQHGADNFAVTEDTAGVDNARKLPDEFVTLAEVLRQRGYATGGIAANSAYLARFWNLQQGFDTWSVKLARARDKNAELQAWIAERQAGDKPWFLFVNYMDTHRPYDTTPRKGLLGRPVIEDEGELLQKLHVAALPGTREVPPGLVQRVTDQYDTSVANLDEQLGALFEHLRATGAWDDTLVIVTADHGEFLGEHHLVEHSKDVYEPVARVPLIVKSPRQTEGRVVETSMSHVDIPSLVLQDLTPGPDASVFPFRPGNHPVITEVNFTRKQVLLDRRWGHRFNRQRMALVEWPYKYIRSSDGAHELFRLDVDPGEEKNLLAEQAQRATSMHRALEQFEASAVRTVRTEVPAQLSPEQLEQLRALGYVDAPHPTPQP